MKMMCLTALDPVFEVFKCVLLNHELKGKFGFIQPAPYL